jgi:hypothetical protein
VLDLLSVLIDCLHNLINLLCHRELCLSARSLGFSHRLPPIPCSSLSTVFFIFGLELSLLEYQFQLILDCPLSAAIPLHLCVHVTVPPARHLTCSLYKALVGICIITNCIWAKSFRGVCPTISSMHKHVGCDMKCRARLCCHLDPVLLA